jgi:hypothetical protein
MVELQAVVQVALETTATSQVAESYAVALADDSVHAWVAAADSLVAVVALPLVVLEWVVC